MAEKKSSGQVTTDVVAQIAEQMPVVAQSLLGNITAHQREMKARFWSRVEINPLLEPSRMSNAAVAQVTGSPMINTWFKDLAFRDWFFSKDTARHKIEAGVEVAVNRLIEILESRDVGPRGAVTAAAQVNAAKLLLEFAGYAPASRKEVIFHDKDVLDMDEAELKAFVAKQVKQQKLVGE